MRRARILTVAVLPASENTGEPNSVAIEELDHLQQVILAGAALQPISAAVSPSGVDDPGVAERPQDLRQIIRGDSRLVRQLPSQNARTLRQSGQMGQRAKCMF